MAGAETKNESKQENSPSILSCINKRTKECCHRGNEVGTVHREEPVPQRKPKEFGKRGL